jgi:ATP phosphoribosyltransferase
LFERAFEGRAPKDQFWENMDELRAAGAEGILVVPIEKMVI